MTLTSSQPLSLEKWVGGQAGVVLEALWGKLALQPALVFSQKGEKLHTTAYINGFAGLSYFEVSSIMT